MAKRKKDEAEVDVGLPIPIPSGGVLDPRMATTMPPIDRGIVVSGPVQSGLNNAVEAKTMNPVMMWLASQGVDVAAEKTGVKDVLRDRAAGLLDLFGLGEAQAAEAVDMPPAQTGFSSPAPAQPIEAQLQPSEPAPAPVVASDVALGNPVPESMEAPLYNRPASEEYIRNVPTENEQAFQLASYYSQQGIDSPKKLGEAATKDPSILNSIKGFLGDEEKMLRLAMAFNTLRMRPDTGLQQFASKRIETIAANRQLNRTADVLEQRGVITKDQAELMRMGIPYKDAIGGNTPAELQTFDKLTSGMSEEDKKKAIRIKLGLDPRAESTLNLTAEELLQRGLAESLGRGRGTELSKQEVETAKLARAESVWNFGIQNLGQKLGATSTGFFTGLLPAITKGQQQADQAVALMGPVMKELFRSAGEGTFTEGDQKLLMDMIPTRGMTPEAIASSIEAIDALVRLKLQNPAASLADVQAGGTGRVTAPPAPAPAVPAAAGEFDGFSVKAAR
jgi:hypothetical protein